MTPSKKKPQRWAYYREIRYNSTVYRVDPSISHKELSSGTIVVAERYVEGKWEEALVGFNTPARCRKDGEYYRSSEGQSINRKWLSLAWQAQGALASLQEVLNRTGLDYIIDIPFLRTNILESLEYKRRAAINCVRQRQLISRDKNSS